jgi:hypothetical protein
MSSYTTWEGKPVILRAPKSRTVFIVSHFSTQHDPNQSEDLLSMNTDFVWRVDMAESGIGARAYFLDWYRWATKINGQTIDTTSSYAIPFSELQETAAYQGLSLDTMRTGDILVIRSGYLAQYATMPDAKRKELDDLYETTKPCNIGVEAGPELLRFLWEKQLAAVAGDSRSFESWPCPENKKEWHLHQWLLAGWGMPIGELWDLEALSALSERLGRWTFFLTSAPMNVPGGVASPPNALAFF